MVTWIATRSDFGEAQAKAGRVHRPGSWGSELRVARTPSPPRGEPAACGWRQASCGCCRGPAGGSPGVSSHDALEPTTSGALSTRWRPMRTLGLFVLLGVGLTALGRVGTAQTTALLLVTSPAATPLSGHGPIAPR